MITVNCNTVASTKNECGGDEVAEPETIPNMVDHPRHYNREGSIECIDEMELIYGPEAVMWFCLLNAHKYRYRAGLKDNGYQDLEKSDWYMKKYKELKEKVEANKIPTSPFSPTSSPNWWNNPDYTITCSTTTTAASK